MNAEAPLRLKDKQTRKLKAPRAKDATKLKMAAMKDKERREKDIVGMKRGYEKKVKT